jgi:Streptomycin 6-kinase
MDATFSFLPRETEQIKARFGEAFYKESISRLQQYAEKWALSSLAFIPSYSANLVFTCMSKAHGPSVLKLANPAFGTMAAEYGALREYGGGRYCQVYEADSEGNALLLERIRPGRPLRDESSLDTRLSVFCSLYEGLHIPSSDPDRYPTYDGWATRITDEMSRRPEWAKLYAHMKRAEQICLSLSAVYSRKMLLHGDLHHDNMLLGEGGRYVIIDPKGVVGDPVFDVPRFVLNEFGDDITDELYGKITGILAVLERRLRIPLETLKQCLYVETVMGLCWSAEDGAGEEERSSMLATAAFAEAVLNG